MNYREKLEPLGPHVMRIVEEMIELCNPSKVTVVTDDDYVKEIALRNGEEISVENGHTVHFDGMFDQGRDKDKTKVLLDSHKLGKNINTMPREEGLAEMKSLFRDSMAGREMFIAFFCLGPPGSRFAIPAMQITDSPYVIHSAQILCRPGYEAMKDLSGSNDFFHFIHSSGELENGVSKNHEKKRIYIDIEENRVFAVNTQYAGNSMGLKKLAFRLAIHKANNSDWLCEHMFLMGVHREKRKTYFCGAYPSACGKTSTAMTSGQSIVGDDLVYMKRHGTRLHAVNVERGMFGILKDVNPKDDPLIYKALEKPGEIIFCNVLLNEGKPYWQGMGQQIPEEGINFSGRWTKGKAGPEGEIPPSHPNSRFTVRLSELENMDPRIDDVDGVPVDVIIYGGRDYNTSPPVVQSFDWSHGVFMGASLDSETTSATVGAQGIRKIDPMAILDFLVVSMGKYFSNHLAIGKMEKPPLIFRTNYFLKKDGEFLNDKLDKKVWLLWMEGRVHNVYRAIETPIGFIPRFDDLRELFKEVFGKEYTREDYRLQFEIRIPLLLDQLKRVEEFYGKEEGIPGEIFKQLHDQKQRLEEVRNEFDKDIIAPWEFEER